MCAFWSKNVKEAAQRNELYVWGSGASGVASKVKVQKVCAAQKGASGAANSKIEAQKACSAKKAGILPSVLGLRYKFESLPMKPSPISEMKRSAPPMKSSPAGMKRAVAVVKN